MIVVDTGVLFAAADRRDQDHAACTALLEGYRPDELIVPAPVLPETAWLIQARLGDHAEQLFVASVANGDVTVAALDRQDYQRCADLLDTYATLALGLVDASLVAVAERLAITTIATLDHRDLRVVRPAHCDAFDLIP